MHLMAFGIKESDTGAISKMEGASLLQHALLYTSLSISLRCQNQLPLIHLQSPSQVLAIQHSSNLPEILKITNWSKLMELQEDSC